MGIAVAATMLAGPLFLAAVPATTAAPETPAELSLTAETQQFDTSAFAARDEAQASRGQDRAALPPVAPVAPAP
ncbi:hypothetical protein, partial [Aquipuribacter hungaricus]